MCCMPGRHWAASRFVVVHGPDMAAVEKEAAAVAPGVQFAEQAKRQGTGHAVSMAKDALAEHKGAVLVLYGDVPLIKAETLREPAVEARCQAQDGGAGF